MCRPMERVCLPGPKQQLGVEIKGVLVVRDLGFKGELLASIKQVSVFIDGAKTGKK